MCVPACLPWDSLHIVPSYTHTKNQHQSFTSIYLLYDFTLYYYNNNPLKRHVYVSVSMYSITKVEVRQCFEKKHNVHHLICLPHLFYHIIIYNGKCSSFQIFSFFSFHSRTFATVAVAVSYVFVCLLQLPLTAATFVYLPKCVCL